MSRKKRWVSSSLPRRSGPPTGETPYQPNPATIHPYQPNPTFPSTDPGSSHRDLQSGGHLEASQQRVVEIQGVNAAGQEVQSPEASQVLKTAVEDGAVATEQPVLENSEELLLEELARDVYALLHSRPAQEEEQGQGAFKKGAEAEEGQINAQGPSAEGANAQRGSTQDGGLDLRGSSGADLGSSPPGFNSPIKSRIPRAEKGKGVRPEHSSSIPSHTPWKTGSKVRSTSTQMKCSDQRLSVNPGGSSWHHGESSKPWTEVKSPYWWRRERQDSTSSAKVRQQPGRVPGTEKFKKLAYGKCFNCFAEDHHVKDCHSLARCWRCNKTGHLSHSCPSRLSASYLRDQQRSPRVHQPLHHPATFKSQPFSPPRTEGRSYLEASRGAPPPVPMAAYPGDPLARLAAESVFITATGATMRRDTLLGRAAVCRLEGNSHDSRPNHVGEALRSRMGMDWTDFQVVRHFPEQYLVIFKEERLCQHVIRQRRLEDEGRIFHFDTWSESRGAAAAHLKFRVHVRLEGIPAHAWGEDVAASILGRSCAIHYVEEHTRRRERTRTYDLWAWCADPCRIPWKVWLTITDPDAEQPPVDVPRNRVQVHHEEPSGLKLALGYEVFPHVAVVEDLSFINGDGGQGGPPNRKRRRTFDWRYGRPDSLGEIRDNRGHDHGRDELRRHRCHNGIDDCYSSTRCRHSFGDRNSGSHRSRGMMWMPKSSFFSNKVVPAPTRPATSKSNKRVSFADPIASVFGVEAPPVAQWLRKDEQGAAVLTKEVQLMDAESFDMSAQAATTINTIIQAHLVGPVHKKALDALQILVEHGTMMEKRGDARTKGVASRMAAA